VWIKLCGFHFLGLNDINFFFHPCIELPTSRLMSLCLYHTVIESSSYIPWHQVSHFDSFCDLQGYGGGILTCPHMGLNKYHVVWNGESMECELLLYKQWSLCKGTLMEEHQPLHTVWGASGKLIPVNEFVYSCWPDLHNMYAGPRSHYSVCEFMCSMRVDHKISLQCI
jgi:hypothetical protein